MSWSELEASWSELGASWSELGVSWSKLEQGGSKGSQLQLASMLPPSPLPPEVVETPIHT